jgi:hypothetical protein
MKTYKVTSEHKDFNKIAKQNGKTIKLSDGNIYSVKSLSKDKVVLAQKTLTRIDTIQDDKDLGKISNDSTHSNAVDEQKPSEGVAKLDLPKAPNDGRLDREHTVDKPKDSPNIPTGGGMNPIYDTNEKNEPEKTTDLLGNQGTITKASKEDIIKIAGQMLQQNMITIDELPNKIAELEQAPISTINDVKTLLNKTDKVANKVEKGLQKEASGSEVPLILKTSSQDTTSNLIQSLQSLSTLNQRNKDHERLSDSKY